MGKVSMDVGKLIQKGRQAKEMTQKDLATKICEKPQVVTEYESGKAVPNQAILGKLERALGIKLRGKDKGKPLAPTAKIFVSTSSNILQFNCKSVETIYLGRRNFGC